MAAHYLEFERPIADLEAKIEELSKLSETAGSGELTGSASIRTTAATVGELRAELMRQSPAAAAALAEGRAVRMALNQNMCEAGAALGSGDEVAFFPPVTGG